MRKVGRASGRRGSPRGRVPPWRSAAPPVPDRPPHRPGRRAAAAARSRPRGRRARAPRRGFRSPRRAGASASGAVGSATGRGAGSGCRPACRRCCRPRSPPPTTASSSELLASRLAPCRPVAAASPQAHRPSTVLRPRRPRRCRPCDSAPPAAPGSARSRGSMPARRQRAAMPGKCAAKSVAQRGARIEEDAMAGGDVSGARRETTSRGSQLGAASARHEPLAAFQSTSTAPSPRTRFA